MDGRYKVILDHYKSLDLEDGEQLRQFFLRYPFLSTNDIAQIVDREHKYIRKLKKRAGMGSKKPPKQPTYIRVPEDIEVPENWRSKEWMTEANKKWGVYTLSRICGVGKRTIWTLLTKHGLKPPKSRINHPCYNREWLLERIVRRGMSINTCSKEAGVSKDTITRWCNNLKIPVRTNTHGPVVGEVDGV